MDALKETDIRPDPLMKRQEEMVGIDIKRLMQRQNEFVLVSCPSCRSINYKTKLNKYGLNYDACLVCGTVFINPRPTPEILEDYYSYSLNYNYWNECIFPASEKVRREQIFRKRVERIVQICKKNNTEPGVLLEVGAGFGIFCEEMRIRRFFKEIIAIEPTPTLAESCRNKGLNVIELPIEKVKLADEYANVIVSFEVIEHLFSPYDFIKYCNVLLKKNGLLILSCPNINGFDIITLKELSKSIDHEHLNYFNPESLSFLLTSNNFDILEVTTPGMLDAELVRKAVLNGKYDLAIQPFLRSILIDRWDELGQKFQDFLAENKLSSHMWVVARKR